MLMRNRPTTVSVVLIVLSGFAGLFAPAVHAQQAPMYRVDPFWPKRLPNKWSMQQVVDIYVDKDDHIWAINRADDARPDELGAMTMPPRTECCVLGPEVLEFDLGRAELCSGLAGPPADHRRGSESECLSFRNDAGRQHHQVHAGR